MNNLQNNEVKQDTLLSETNGYAHVYIPLSIVSSKLPEVFLKFLGININ